MSKLAGGNPSVSSVDADDPVHRLSDREGEGSFATADVEYDIVGIQSEAVEHLEVLVDLRGHE